MVYKKVDIYPKRPITTVNPPIRGAWLSVIKSVEEIKLCLEAEACVYEILPDGSSIELNLDNYNIDNYIEIDENEEEETSDDEDDDSSNTIENNESDDNEDIIEEENNESDDDSSDTIENNESDDNEDIIEEENNDLNNDDIYDNPEDDDNYVG